ncbi:MAG: DnaD domain protein [Chloroflexi bacterium]|nr:DnaD domain protein [Chloroflexota bacterium]
MDERDGDLNEVPVARELFTAVVPRIEDLAELKLALYVAYLAAQRGTPAVPVRELHAPTILRDLARPSSPEPAEERLQRVIERAVANGTLLRIAVRTGDGPAGYLLPASRANRDLIDRMRTADPDAERELELPPRPEVTIYRPNVFAFYERHVGPLTPLVAEQLRDAERSYPRAWIEEAILAALHYNHRSWQYVQAILTRWEATGGPDRFAR